MFKMALDQNHVILVQLVQESPTLRRSTEWENLLRPEMIFRRKLSKLSLRWGVNHRTFDNFSITLVHFTRVCEK